MSTRTQYPRLEERDRRLFLGKLEAFKPQTIGLPHILAASTRDVGPFGLGAP